MTESTADIARVDLRSTALGREALFASAVAALAATGSYVIADRSLEIQRSVPWFFAVTVMWFVGALVAQIGAQWRRQAGTAGFARRDASALRLVRITIALAVFGWLFQFRVGGGGGDAPFHLGLALLLLLVGVAAGEWFRSTAASTRSPQIEYVAFVGAFLLLATTIVLGETVNGARIQLRGVQPGELARLLIVVGFAAYLSRPISQLMRQGPGDQADRRWIPAGFVTASCVVSGSFFLFIVQKDLSPVLALVVTLSLMMWQAYGRPWRYVAVPLGLLLVLVWMVVRISAFDHVQVRYQALMDPFSAASRTTQLGSALAAFERGGWFGSGLGVGTPDQVPAAETDYIIVVPGEELGLAGVMVITVLVIALLHVLWSRAAGARAAAGPHRPVLGASLVGGIAAMFTASYLITALGVSGLFLHGGLTMPFLSAGGSSLAVSGLAVGLAIGAGRQDPSPSGWSDEVAAREERGARYLPGLLAGIVIVALVVNAVWRLPPTREADVAQQLQRDWYATRSVRGSIETADGVVVAYSAGGPTDMTCPKWSSALAFARRCYPAGRLYSDVLGFVTVDNPRALEELIAESLRCDPSALDARIVRGSCASARSATITIDSRLQDLAAAELGDREGAIILSDPTTGEVLAMYGAPSYDPNVRVLPDPVPFPRTSEEVVHHLEALAVVDEAGAAEVEAEGLRRWEETVQRPERQEGMSREERKRDDALHPPSPVVPASAVRQEAYPAGSVFKLVTAAAVVDAGRADVEVDVPTSYRGVENSNSACDGITAGLVVLLAQSCNTGFGVLADEIGPDALSCTAQRLGFEAPTSAEEDGPCSPSVGPVLDGLTIGPSPAPVPPAKRDALPAVAIGEDTRVTPIQMHRIVSAIANDGVLVGPTVVAGEETRRLSGRPLDLDVPTARIFSPEAVEVLDAGMREAVLSGTAQDLGMSGVTVAAKTGTPREESPDGEVFNDAWVVAYAAAGDKTYAVTVFLRGTPDESFGGGRDAVPVARAMLEKAFDLD